MDFEDRGFAWRHCEHGRVGCLGGCVGLCDRVC